ncbi:uncharacterized protein [Hoplias malabaricus]|uniref:uncharacterized protein n=1 Tax=Hoplias malabaricus TaxID=27720 RepID=UPI003462C5BB
MDPSRREVITTDASPTGWGAVCHHRAVQGLWSDRQAQSHINTLELRAIWLALRHFLPILQGRHVLVRSDNMSAVYYVNHFGGTRSRELLSIAQGLWTWAYPRFLSLRAAHVAGSSNNVADTLSRHTIHSGRWRLHPEVIQSVWKLFRKAQVDLFASRDTTHCPLWFSEEPQDSPLGEDALAHDWPRALLYAFPPFPLLPALLDRVRWENHRVLLVAPQWPYQPWFPLLLSLVQGTPWELPSHTDLLSQLRGQVWHPQPERRRLWLWPLGPPLG